jgi:hypothetical protein
MVKVRMLISARAAFMIEISTTKVLIGDLAHCYPAVSQIAKSVGKVPQLYASRLSEKTGT